MESGFLSYLWHSFRQNSIWMLWRRGLEWFRRFRLVAILLRTVAFVWGILQTGAMVIFSTLILLVALPLLVALMLGILLTAVLETRRSNRMLLEKTENKNVYVLFLPRERCDFFTANAYDLARNEGHTVIAISPYWISSRGLKKGYFYCTVRREAESLYLVRRFYFFALKRRVLSKRKTAYLY